MSVKEQVLQAINRLPDDIDYRDAAEEIALLAAVGGAEAGDRNSFYNDGRLVTQYVGTSSLSAESGEQRWAKQIWKHRFESACQFSTSPSSCAEMIFSPFNDSTFQLITRRQPDRMK